MIGVRRRGSGRRRRVRVAWRARWRCLGGGGGRRRGPAELCPPVCRHALRLTLTPATSCSSSQDATVTPSRRLSSATELLLVLLLRLLLSTTTTADILFFAPRSVRSRNNLAEQRDQQQPPPGAHVVPVDLHRSALIIHTYVLLLPYRVVTRCIATAQQTSSHRAQHVHNRSRRRCRSGHRRVQRVQFRQLLVPPVVFGQRLELQQP